MFKALSDGTTPIEGKDFRISALGLNMIWVNKGSFFMGTKNLKAPKNERPQTLVTLTRGYWIASMETQQVLYAQLMKENPSENNASNLPVENVTFYDARIFCRKLTELERQRQCLPDGYSYGLPTEAQWEFAAQGGAGKKNLNQPPLNESDWHRDNSDMIPHPTGKKTPRLPGLHDMLGNVHELCEGRSGRYPGTQVNDWEGPLEGTFRIARGGSWFSSPNDCRTTFRLEVPSDFRMGNIGFRGALVPVKNKETGKKP